MADIELDDSVESMQAKDTENTVPVGVWVLFGGLVAWGVWYFLAYVGWDQAADLQGGGAGIATNIGATVAYTAVATAVAIALALTMSRRRARGK